MTSLAPHPDRLLPADPATRALARDIYSSVREAPILSPHGHVDASILVENAPFDDPAALLITPDHYVLRLLHAVGVPLEQLGVEARDGSATTADGREIWRALASHWDVFLGTPVRYWFETELHDVFGLTEHPSAANADTQYDQLAAALQAPSMRPRALFDAFRIEVLATTDDPASDLAAHAALRDDPTFSGRVLPTFRADSYYDPARPEWRSSVEHLASVAGVDTTTHAGLLEALRSRREHFIRHGATASDTGVPDAGSEPLDASDAARIHDAALRGTVSTADAAAYRRTMLFESAKMAADDGLVMQLHPGILRNHHRPTLERFGPDVGDDLPLISSSYTEPLRPILEAFGTHPRFRMVLFTVDETVFTREIGPLAGFYLSVYAGAPWWFIDTPAAIRRYREAITDSVGFTKTSGFIDDTRAFCSIPARHDMSRRVDAGYLASLVVTHQISEDDAHRVAHDLVDTIPRATFRL
ncbi:glucuronate isomerase [Frondihabitans sp. PAMC 28766]|uniref:glucuronate isomerase n=1 Tax=Frondihabitans sp. PAMC 28766 TaxID=1795630 RepID=UPI00078C3F7B|nr:glucuronate isomerase [Frondihabitans sp. PAMC 28766]AMM20354.1 glucuronate isomerase [Frondihabitans sp. PAMC 28766]